jgi:hypothetical protein
MASCPRSSGVHFNLLPSNDMSKLGRSACLILLLGSLTASSLASPQSDPAIQVSVKDVRVNGLLYYLAELDNLSMVTGGFPPGRISVNAEDPSGDELLDHVIKQVRGRVEVRKGIAVVRGPCVEDAAPAIPIAPETKVTMRLTAASPRSVVALLVGLQPKPSAPMTFSDGSETGVVGLHVVDKPASAIYEALVRASGLQIERTPEGGLVAHHSTRCMDRKVETLEAPLRGVVNPEDCPRHRYASELSKSYPPCSTLEYYKLENFVLKGYVRTPTRFVAIAETPDGITWLLEPNMRLGHDFGRIANVDEHGVTVKETVLNGFGYYYEQTIAIDYENHRHPLLTP